MGTQQCNTRLVLSERGLMVILSWRAEQQHIHRLRKRTRCFDQQAICLLCKQCRDGDVGLYRCPVEVSSGPNNVCEMSFG
jgi:hypothetical protein